MGLSKMPVTYVICPMCGTKRYPEDEGNVWVYRCDKCGHTDAEKK